jgi:NADH-quinone oxidoreductase subunit J
VSLGVLALTVGALASTGFEVTGPVGELDVSLTDIERLGESLFTDYLFAFEITSVLLVIAVVGAITLARRPRGEEIVDPGQAEREAQLARRMAAAEARAGGDGAAADGERTEEAEGAEAGASGEATAEEVTR